jgi:plastocyanin
MDGSLFYWVGGLLIAAALVLSAIGIRGRESFPRSKAQMAGVLGLFALIVVGTAVYGVANASEEQDHRNAELAEQETTASGDVAAAGQGEAPANAPAPGSPGGSPSGKPPASAATTLDLSSPDDGSTVFDPTGLQTDAGSVTLAYDNPSPVTHNVAIEDDSGKLLGQSDDVAAGTVDLTLDQVPGQYTYFGSIPGHREAGMEGTLEVQ